MASWFAIYDDTSKDVEGAGFFADPDSVEPGTGKSLSAAQAGDIPNDLIAENGDSNYVYNTETDLVEAKA